MGRAESCCGRRGQGEGKRESTWRALGGCAMGRWSLGAVGQTAVLDLCPFEGFQEGCSPRGRWVYPAKGALNVFRDRLDLFVLPLLSLFLVVRGCCA